MSNAVARLNDLGQSPWYDNLTRALVRDGELAALIAKDGIRGVTSNPTIFEKAMAEGIGYDEQLLELADLPIEAIYWKLVETDIAGAADLLRPVYDTTMCRDGFVSVEVSPDLAHDSAQTVVQAKELFARLGRPNVMIKIPATPAGIPAIAEVIASGINVNVTLIFSLRRYEEVIDAFLEGIERLVGAGGDPSKVASVASFFVSRVDTEVDKLLPDRHELRGKVAVANARLAYRLFEQRFSGERWDRLVEAGALPQRPLWASTSTKNPAYSDTLYVDELIGRRHGQHAGAIVDRRIEGPRCSAARDLDQGCEPQRSRFWATSAGSVSSTTKSRLCSSVTVSRHFRVRITIVSAHSSDVSPSCAQRRRPETVRVPPATCYFPPEDRTWILEQVEDCLATGQLTLGLRGRRLEEEFAAYLGVAHAVAVNSGTSALEISLRALGVMGKEVLVPANTFYATAAAVLAAGARPRFVDCDPETMAISPTAARTAIGPETVGMIVVHIAGMVTPAIGELLAICDASGIFCIEDAAHAHGSAHGGSLAGTFGVAAAFSFYPTKVMAAGEGGMIVTNDDGLAEEARIYRDQGKASFLTNLHTRLGYNWRMSEPHAAMALTQLRRLDEFIDHRQRVAQRYREAMSFLGLTPIDVPGEAHMNYYKFVAYLPDGVDRAGPQGSVARDTWRGTFGRGVRRAVTSPAGLCRVRRGHVIARRGLPV